MRKFSYILKEYYTEKRFTPSYISDRCDFTEGKVRTIINGSVALKMEDYIKICDAMNVSPMYLMERYLKERGENDDEDCSSRNLEKNLS